MRFSSLVARDLLRRPGPAALAALAVACAVAVQVIGGGIGESARRLSRLAAERPGPDLMAVPDDFSGGLERACLNGEAGEIFLDASMLNRIAGHGFVARTSALLFAAPLGQDAGCSAPACFLVGFEPESDFMVRPWLARDRDRPLAPDDALVGADFGVESGGVITALGHRFRVAAVLEPSGSWLDRTAFIPLPAARLLTGPAAEGRISAVTIKLKPADRGGLSPSEAAYRLNKGIYEVRVYDARAFDSGPHAAPAVWARGLSGAALALWPAAALIIGLTAAGNASRRRREIGLLRGIGATRSLVFALLVGEAMVLALAGALAGALAALGFLAGLGPPQPGTAAFVPLALAAVILAAVVSAAAAVPPALAAARQDPAQALRPNR